MARMGYNNQEGPWACLGPIWNSFCLGLLGAHLGLFGVHFNQGHIPGKKYVLFFWLARPLPSMNQALVAIPLRAHNYRLAMTVATNFLAFAVPVAADLTARMKEGISRKARNPEGKKV